MNVYDLESVKLPVMKGAALRLMASALDNPALRPLLLHKLIKAAGIPKLREMDIQCPPTFYPLVHANDPSKAGGGSPLDLEPAASQSAFRTVRDFAHAYRSKSTTPEEVAHRVIEKLDADACHAMPLRAIIAWDRNDLLDQARESARRIEAGQARSLLEGVPVAIKDEVDQLPYPTRVGTRLFGTKPPTADATVVRRLREAGGLLIGKANMHEIGINPNGHNMHYGMARNPYNRSHDSGGSSSGSAGAVAAGYCPVSLGADGGGSIRVPAALCGLVGLKPTFGRISEFGAAPVCWSLAHLGPLGTCVEDVAVAYALMAGPDLNDPISGTQPPPRWKDWNNSDLTGLRVGVFRPWFEHASDEIVAANDAAVQYLRQSGALLREIEIPDLDGIRIAHAITILSEMAASMDSLEFPRRGFAPSTRISLAAGRAFKATDYVTAQRMRTRAMRTFAKLFQQVDLIVTPTTAMTAPTIPEEAIKGGWSNLSETTEIMRFIVPGNFVGMPALSVPVGYAPNGLPIGMQLMAAHWREDLLFRAGQVIESHIHRRAAECYTDLLDTHRETGPAAQL